MLYLWEMLPGFSPQSASSAEGGSMSWHHHGKYLYDISTHCDHFSFLVVIIQHWQKFCTPNEYMYAILLRLTEKLPGDRTTNMD